MRKSLLLRWNALNLIILQNSENISKQYVHSTISIIILLNMSLLSFNNTPVSHHAAPYVINNFLINITSWISANDAIKLDEVPRLCGPLPDKLFLVLNSLKLKKAIGPDCIPNKLLKSLYYLLAVQVCAIINSLFVQALSVISGKYKN